MSNTTIESVAKHTLGTSVTVLPTVAEANQMFLEAAGHRPDDGSNGKELGKFLLTMERVTSHSGSFSFHDVIRESKGYELSSADAMNLFTRWVEVMEKLNKVTRVQSIYDYPLYVLIA